MSPCLGRNSAFPKYHSRLMTKSQDGLQPIQYKLGNAKLFHPVEHRPANTRGGAGWRSLARLPGPSNDFIDRQAPVGMFPHPDGLPDSYPVCGRPSAVRFIRDAVSNTTLLASFKSRGIQRRVLFVPDSSSHFGRNIFWNLVHAVILFCMLGDLFHYLRFCFTMRDEIAVQAD